MQRNRYGLSSLFNLVHMDKTTQENNTIYFFVKIVGKHKLFVLFNASPEPIFILV